MEVNILEARNPPVMPVLAIHAGTVSRQAKLEVNQPFVIPHPGSQTCAVEVTLFQQLATQILPDDGAPEVTCSIPVRTPEGASSQVKLLVRRDSGSLSDATKPPVNQDNVGLTKDYLAQHQLQQRIQNLIQDVLREQPDDPYRYMFEQLRRCKNGKGAEAPAPPPPEAGAPKPAPPAEEAPQEQAATPPQAPLVPAPPQKPKPTGNKAPRPRNFIIGGKEEVSYVSNRRPSEDVRLASIIMHGVLRSPRCMKVAAESIRNNVQKDMAASKVSSILKRTRDAAISLFVESQSPRAQSKLVRASLFKSAGEKLSPQYHAAVTRWCVNYTLRSAANIIAANDERRRACFINDHNRRVSLPTPIVFLGGESSSWGNWLSGVSGSASRGP